MSAKKATKKVPDTYPAQYIRAVPDFSGKARNLYRDDESPRLAARHTNGYTSEETTVENVRNHLKAALQALDGQAGSMIPLAGVSRAVDLYEALSEIEHILPEVEAWCVYRLPNSDGSFDRIYCGCLSKAQAEELLKAVKKYEETREAAHPHWGERDKDSTRLVVRRMSCRILDLIKANVTGEQLTKNWGR
jgi:hypothetical protein